MTDSVPLGAFLFRYDFTALVHLFIPEIFLLVIFPIICFAKALYKQSAVLAMIF